MSFRISQTQNKRSDDGNNQSGHRELFIRGSPSTSRTLSARTDQGIIKDQINQRSKLVHLSHGGKMDKIIKAPSQRQSSQRALGNFVRFMHSVILYYNPPPKKRERK